MLIEQLRYNLLFRWFVGLSMDDKIWDVSTFSKNRKRFLDGEISERFFSRCRRSWRVVRIFSATNTLRLMGR